MMKSFYLAVVAAAGLLLAAGMPATAHGSGSHSGSPSVPSFSTGHHNGFETPEAGTLPEPKGWDQGKAAWKGDTTTSTTDPATGVTTTTTTESVPPGFSKP
jgi:hypothetical protein